MGQLSAPKTVPRETPHQHPNSSEGSLWSPRDSRPLAHILCSPTALRLGGVVGSLCWRRCAHQHQRSANIIYWHVIRKVYVPHVRFSLASGQHANIVCTIRSFVCPLVHGCSTLARCWFNRQNQRYTITMLFVFLVVFWMYGRTYRKLNPAKLTGATTRHHSRVPGAQWLEVAR